jgi:hypothetical protein
MIRVLWLLLLALAVLAPAGRLAAQPASPVASPVVAACTIAPRTVGGIAEIITQADLDNASPFPTPGPYVQPAGTPADEATVAGVTATVDQLAACVNAGDFMRFLALFSDAALRRYAVDLDLPLTADDERLVADPSINDQLAVASIEDVLVLADGRVSVLVHFQIVEETGNPEYDLQLILARVDDRWAIDEFIQIVPAETPATPWAPVSGAGYEGVIVDAASAPEFARWLTGQENATGWEPTPEDIATLEAALPAFLQTAPEAAPDLWQRVATYLRQYVGIIDTDGRPVILVNAFCNAAGVDWHSESVLVLDGGDCYFSVVYDPMDGTFSQLRINGEA